MSSKPVSVKSVASASSGRSEASPAVGLPIIPGRKSTVSSATVGRYMVLTAFLFYCVLPAAWIIAAMTKDNGQIFTTFGLWFSYPFHVFENLSGLVTYQDWIFVRWFGNSLIYAGSISFGSTLICALGGYAFSKYEFPGKQFLFNFILGTIMVPSTALVLPLFLMLNKIGLVNTMWGVILPSLVNPFGLYLMKVFWDSSLPNELIEASRLEGANELQIFWRIGIPLMQTGLVTVALLGFVGAWNNFFLPLIVLSEQKLYPLTLGLNVWNSVSSGAGGKPIYNLIAMGSLVSVLPLLIAFVVLGKYWRGGLTAGATKG
ncbi:MAG: carbohydrate ABC transporter permease [Verrucomicrobia bacterium]|nr:carbohydrate ABC transporter permease [Verrucomicrobiota bacterium]